VFRRFCRVLGDIDARDATPLAVRAFLDGDRALTNAWFLNYRLLRGLFSFAISCGFVRRSPLPDLTPSPLPAFRPHMYSAIDGAGRLPELQGGCLDRRRECLSRVDDLWLVCVDWLGSSWQSPDTASNDCYTARSGSARTLMASRPSVRYIDAPECDAVSRYGRHNAKAGHRIRGTSRVGSTV
jgi:hypothetical protein